MPWADDPNLGSHFGLSGLPVEWPKNFLRNIGVGRQGAGENEILFLQYRILDKEGILRNSLLFSLPTTIPKHSAKLTLCFGKLSQ